MRALPFLLLIACGSGSAFDTGPFGTENCRHPEFTEPMTQGEVIPPYSWETARHRSGGTASLELDRVMCANDDDIDWSPHDVLLFVSIPAW